MGSTWAARTRAAVTTLVISAAVGSVARAQEKPPETSPASATEPATAPATAPTTAPSPPAATAPAATAPAAAPEPGVHAVKRGSIALEVKGEGLFQPVDAFEVKLAFKNFAAYGGPLVVKSIAAPGAAVKRGDVLLELDREHLAWTLAAADAELAGARAGMAKAEADAALGERADALALKTQEVALANAEAGQKWWEQVDGPQMLLSSELSVKQAQDSLDDQNDELDQLRKMYKGEELTTATADIVIKRALRAYDRSKVVLKMQQERAGKTKEFEYPILRQKGVDGIEVTRNNLAALKAQQAVSAVTRKGSLLAARIALEQTEKKVRELKEDAELFTWKAPADGVVTYGTIVDGAWVGGDPKGLELGDKLSAGQVVMRVYAPGKMRVVLPLNDLQSFWLAAGMKARVTPSAFPQNGYVATCSAPEAAPKASPAAVAFQVTLDPGDVDRRLLPGMKATVQIDAGKVENALLVPAGAVTNGRVSVRDKDKRVTERDVTLGMTDGSSVEIRAGLSEGDEVVLPGKK